MFKFNHNGVIIIFIYFLEDTSLKKLSIVTRYNPTKYLVKFMHIVE